VTLTYDSDGVQSNKLINAPEIIISNKAGLPGILSFPSSFAPPPITAGDGQFYWSGDFASRSGDIITIGTETLTALYAYCVEDESQANWDSEKASWDFTTAFGTPVTETTITSNASLQFSDVTYNTLGITYGSGSNYWDITTLPATVFENTVGFISPSYLHIGAWVEFPSIGFNGGPLLGQTPSSIEFGLYSTKDIVNIGIAYSITTGAAINAYAKISNNEVTQLYQSPTVTIDGVMNYIAIDITNTGAAATWSGSVNGVEFVSSTTTANYFGKTGSMAIRGFDSGFSNGTVSINTYVGGTNTNATTLKFLDFNVYKK
jgi:hypothetical protein